jgi:hypothetical protein
MTCGAAAEHQAAKHQAVELLNCSAFLIRLAINRRAIDM